MTTANRPVSPHLGVYRWQITMTMSILHRLAGLALAVGTLALVYWLVAAGMGPDDYAQAQWFFGTWFGQFLLWGWTFSLFYHLCNGIRHLAWDAGWGFEIKPLYITGYTVWIVAAVLTAAALWLAYGSGGMA
ncbi:MAG TPA: succinate dehydrogenase, cytochrome b556 subunit [Gammaproteobacteria bacterium]|nr:succinate dehydrogenase, cytochrome b556 subunit [Gammaproteobacteria bacterium]